MLLEAPGALEDVEPQKRCTSGDPVAPGRVARSAKCGLPVAATVRAMNGRAPCPDCGDLHQPGAGPCPDASLAGCTLPGGLCVFERLGETSVGPLYHAEYVDSGVEVTLVILQQEASGRAPSSDTSDRARLQDQLRQATGIKHPNVATVYAVAETPEGLSYMAFEMVRGELLSEYIAARPALLLEEAVDLCLQAAAGLQATHDAGFVHGNLSPDTILVTQTRDDRPLVKLIRFGLIQDGGDRPAAQQQPTEYASPERLSGQAPDERSDVFGLGAVFHYLLTRAPPGTEVNQAELIPEAVRFVLASALAPLPADRFQTIEEFSRALKRATGRRPSWIRGLTPSWIGDLTPRALTAGAIGAGLAVAIAGHWFLGHPQRSRTGAAPDETATASRPLPTTEVSESARSPLISLRSAVPLDSAPLHKAAGSLPASKPGGAPPRQRELAPTPAVAAAPESVASEATESKAPEPGPGNSTLIDTLSVMAPREEMPRQSATPPPVAPAPAPVQPTPPARPKPAPVGRVDAEAEARAGAGQTLAAYARALESQDLKAVERVYPGLTARERAAWRQFFKVTREFEVPLNIGRLAMVDSGARLDVRGTYQYWNRSLHRPDRTPVSFVAMIRRSPDGWRLTAIH
jgi:serine/threonine protein kinase